MNVFPALFLIPYLGFVASQVVTNVTPMGVTETNNTPINATPTKPAVMCYYNMLLAQNDTSFNHRDYMEYPIQHCTHLIFGFASFNMDGNLVFVNNQLLDIRVYGEFLATIKTKNPDITILLSIGGGVDENADNKYLKFLEQEKAIPWIQLGNEINKLFTVFLFDGVDIAWQFPETQQDHSSGRDGVLSAIKQKLTDLVIGVWGYLKRIEHAVVDKFIETQVFTDYKSLFVQFIGTIRATLPGVPITVSVLPNVNTTTYYNVEDLLSYVNYIILWGFDFYTPARSSDKADFPAPLRALPGRNAQENVDAMINALAVNDTSKLILGLPTFARGWTMNNDSPNNGVPPLKVEGESEHFLSYSQVCSRLPNRDNAKQPNVLKVPRDGTLANPEAGAYAFSPGKSGTWIGYDSENTLDAKVKYATNEKKLGGVALVYVNSDDIRGRCTGHPYPLLTTVVNSLMESALKATQPNAIQTTADQIVAAQTTAAVQATTAAQPTSAAQPKQFQQPQLN